MVKKRIKRTIGFALKPFGMDRHVGRVPAVTGMKSPLEAVYSQRDVVFEVPIENCVSSYQLSYGLQGWHPFVKTLRQYLEEPALTYEDSVLRRYYEAYQPKRLWDVFFECKNEDEPLVESGLKTLSADAYFAPNPWDEKLSRVRGEGRLAASHGVQAYGPVSLEKGEWEFQRLINVCRSIRSKGYRPSRDSDGEIRGYFLRMGPAYKFFVRAGMHRMAAVAALEYPKIRVKFKANFPRTVDLADIAHWPLVKSGFLEKPIAAQIFGRYFTEDGTGKARNLGLL